MTIPTVPVGIPELSLASDPAVISCCAPLYIHIIELERSCIVKMYFIECVQFAGDQAKFYITILEWIAGLYISIFYLAHLVAGYSPVNL